MRKPSLLMISELTQIPFGHVCLVSSARAEGVDADVFFDALQRQDELFELLRDNPPTGVGFSAYDSNIPAMDQFFDKVRAVAPSAWIGIGGPTPSNCLKGSVIVTTADFGIRGACEYVLPKVLHILADIEKGGTLSVAERQLQQIPSFYGLINGREVICTDEKNYLGRDIENVPLDFSIFGKEGRTDCIGLVTQRGCGYRTCNFCTPQIVEGIWYGLSPDRMIGLLVQLKKLIEEGTIHYGAKNIKFQDNDFLFDRTRAIEFAEKIRSRGLNDYFRFQTAQSSIDTLLVDHKSGNDVDIELVRLTRACYEELGLGTDGFTANDLKWLGKDRYNMKDIFRIAEVLFGERLPQKHYAILSNHKTTVNDLLLACYNIAKIAAINYPFFKIDANIGTQSFIGTKISF